MKSKTMVILIVAALPLTACASEPAGQSRDSASSTSAPRDTVLAAGTAGSPAVAPSGRVPLKVALSSLEFQDVRHDFCRLTKVARPSHHKEKVREFLVQFGKQKEIVP